ncbi:hypothetical protein J6590_012841 [Homalodisca vitripennis]|nr:hypothetical protein J6590_012841 [Homalodisca vitripennis]
MRHRILSPVLCMTLERVYSDEKIRMERKQFTSLRTEARNIRGIHSVVHVTRHVAAQPTCHMKTIIMTAHVIAALRHRPHSPVWLEVLMDFPEPSTSGRLKLARQGDNFVQARGCVPAKTSGLPST